MWSPHGFLHGIEWIMLHSHLDYFQTNDLLDVRLTKNRETMALRTHITVDSFYSSMHEDPAWVETHWNSICGWRSGHIWLHATLEDPWPHDMSLEVCWDDLSTDTLVGSHNFTVTARGSWLVAHVWSYDRWEPAVSYRWTGWVWEKTCWSSRLQENYGSF